MVKGKKLPEGKSDPERVSYISNPEEEMEEDDDEKVRTWQKLDSRA